MINMDKIKALEQIDKIMLNLKHPPHKQLREVARLYHNIGMLEHKDDIIAAQKLYNKRAIRMLRREAARKK